MSLSEFFLQVARQEKLRLLKLEKVSCICCSQVPELMSQTQVTFCKKTELEISM